MSDKSKVIIITGASSGIGFDAARRLAAQGHRVYAAARRLELMEPLKSDGVQVLQLDVTDDASMVVCVDTVLEREGRVDVLVNNAGYGYFGAVENVSMAEARRQVDVNVFGLARMCQLVLPAMRRQGSGRIINISSVAGKAAFYLGAWYNVTKYSVEALSDALRMEAKPLGIDVVLIEPGPIRTDWGIIAARNLVQSSAGTAYEEQASPWATTIDWAYRSHLFTGPQVITNAICRAVNSRRPRVRYCRGRAAGLILLLHSVMPARCWDAIMRRAARLKLGAKG